MMQRVDDNFAGFIWDVTSPQVATHDELEVDARGGQPRPDEGSCAVVQRESQEPESV
jgi:hypothetical protein